MRERSHVSVRTLRNHVRKITSQPSTEGAHQPQPQAPLFCSRPGTPMACKIYAEKYGATRARPIGLSRYLGQTKPGRASRTCKVITRAKNLRNRRRGTFLTPNYKGWQFIRIRLTASFDELSHRQREQGAKVFAYRFFMPLPDNPEIYDRKTDDCQGEWKHHAVLEHIVSQMANVSSRSQTTEHRKYSARKSGTYDNHCKVYAEVNKFVQFTV